MKRPLWKPEEFRTTNSFVTVFIIETKLWTAFFSGYQNIVSLMRFKEPCPGDQKIFFVRKISRCIHYNKNWTCSGPRKIGLGKQNIESFPLSKKWDISDNGYEILTSLRWDLQSSSAINRPLPGIGKGEGDAYFNDCGVRKESVKDEKGMGQVKLVSEQSYYYYYYYYTFVSGVIFLSELYNCSYCNKGFCSLHYMSG